MKKYKFEVVVFEMNDEFWEKLEKDNKTGCDEVTEMVRVGLNAAFLDYNLKLVRYTDE